jgi:septal ring factor EnvC (AmiA/AmiB activator)
MSDEERLVAEIDADLKQLAKADPRSIRDIVESSLEREFATGATAAVERRIDEKRQRIQTLQREINDRKRELAEERDALERLEQQLESYEGDKADEVQKALDALAETPADPDNPAVKTWAAKVGMTPDRLADKLEDAHST